MTTITYSLKEIDSIAKKLLESTNEIIFLFYGEMGVGKTTLIKAIAKQLGVEHETSSPTFSLVNEYEGNGKSIFHFDFYRLENEEEALDMGLEDYLSGNHIICIEWPEKIATFLPENCKKVHLEATDDKQRIITF
ncbi:tRNA (adenosine(37)-N6)-threonylcarbamoyltransferase complex ATPase subunit type 1 TsaE [Flavobacteriaceae bacterium R38]|nr:tRNA (adenosine(37)-N6)-threonylcarbamoyltransferase complex ATPase subunit type 1 TsaE [Flavobacteriaceae bacterium R38]